MKTIIAIAVFVTLAAGLAQGQDIAGDWQGTLNAGTAQLHLIVHASYAPRTATGTSREPWIALTRALTASPSTPSWLRRFKFHGQSRSTALMKARSTPMRRKSLVPGPRGRRIDYPDLDLKRDQGGAKTQPKGRPAFRH